MRDDLPKLEMNYCVIKLNNMFDREKLIELLQTKFDDNCGEEYINGDLLSQMLIDAEVPVFD